MRIEAAGLLWGYGVAFAVAVAWTEFARWRVATAWGVRPSPHISGRGDGRT